MLPAVWIRAVMVSPRLRAESLKGFVMNARELPRATAGVSGNLWISLLVDLPKPWNSIWSEGKEKWDWRGGTCSERSKAEVQSGMTPEKAADSHRFSAAEDLSSIAHPCKALAWTNATRLHLDLVFASSFQIHQPHALSFQATSHTCHRAVLAQQNYGSIPYCFPLAALKVCVLVGTQALWLRGLLNYLVLLFVH